MFLSNDETSRQVSRLVEEAREYLLLQKRYVSLRSTEVATKIFAAFVTITILILVSFIVLLFGGMALALWIGAWLGNEVWGYAIVAGVLAFAAWIIYARRHRWIMAPIARYMIRLLAPSSTASTLNDIEYEKTETDNERQHYSESLKEHACALVSAEETPTSKIDRMITAFRNGYNVFRGVQMGMTAVTTLRRIFRRR